MTRKNEPAEPEAIDVPVPVEAPPVAGPATYRALKGFSYPRPGGAIEVTYQAEVDGKPVEKKVMSREIHVEAGAAHLSPPEGIVAALLAAGAIEKE